MAATVITAKKMLSVRAMRLPFMLLPAIPDSIKMMTPVVVSTTGKIRDLFTLLFRIDAARKQPDHTAVLHADRDDRRGLPQREYD